jgi:hypothetical protein
LADSVAELLSFVEDSVSNCMDCAEAENTDNIIAFQLSFFDLYGTHIAVVTQCADVIRSDKYCNEFPGGLHVFSLKVYSADLHWIATHDVHRLLIPVPKKLYFLIMVRKYFLRLIFRK